MEQYLNIARDVMNNGHSVETRNGRTMRKFGYSFEHDIENGAAFPLLTTKEIKLDLPTAEWYGFINGFTSAYQFRKEGVKVWDANANSPGTPENPNAWLSNPFRRGPDDLGPIYGKQWISWDSTKIVPVRRRDDSDLIDAYKAAGYVEIGRCGILSGEAVIMQRKINQLDELMAGLRANPFGRRHVVSAWNVGELSQMALPPCHDYFQVFINANESTGEPEKVDLFFHMRSVDVFLGMPFNLASYGLMLMAISHMLNLRAGRLLAYFGDTHIYNDHIPQIITQLRRTPKPLPTVDIVMERAISEEVRAEHVLPDGMTTELIPVAQMRPGETEEQFYARVQKRTDGANYWSVPSPYQSFADFNTKSFRLSEYDPYPALHGRMAV